MTLSRRDALAALLGSAFAPDIRPVGPRRGQTDHARFRAGRRGKRMAHRQHRVGQERRRRGRHQPEILRRAAEAGKPDQGDPLVHRAESRCDRVFAGRRIGLGTGAARSEEREDPGDPDRPQHRREGQVALRDDDRLGLPRRRPPRGQMARRTLQGRTQARSTSPNCRARSAPRPRTTGARACSK